MGYKGRGAAEHRPALQYVGLTYWIVLAYHTLRLDLAIAHNLPNITAFDSVACSLYACCCSIGSPESLSEVLHVDRIDRLERHGQPLD